MVSRAPTMFAIWSESSTSCPVRSPRADPSASSRHSAAAAIPRPNIAASLRTSAHSRIGKKNVFFLVISVVISAVTNVRVRCSCQSTSSMPKMSLLLAAACLLAGHGARGDWDGGGDGGEGELAAGGPQPVAQLTLTITDGAGKQSSVTATVMPEEDAAAAAVRFCSNKGLTQPRQVIDITGYLKGALQGKEHEPEGLELLRTAGAYSRRAAESSKEENYAEAAAGLPPLRWHACFVGLPSRACHRAQPACLPSCLVIVHVPLQTWCARSIARGSTRRQRKKWSANCPRHFGICRSSAKPKRSSEKSRRRWSGAASPRRRRRRCCVWVWVWVGLVGTHARTHTQTHTCTHTHTQEAKVRKAADEEDWAAFASQLRAKLHLAKGDEAPDAGPNIISAIELTLHRESGTKQKEEISARAQVSRFILFIIYLFIVVSPLSLSCRAPVNAPIVNFVLL